MDTDKVVIKRLQAQLRSVKRRSSLKSEKLRLAKDELRRCMAQKVSIEQAAVNAIFSIDAEGNVINWNDAAKKMFGYTLKEVLGNPITMFVPEEHHSAHDEGMKKVALHGSGRVHNQPIEVQGITKTGKEVPIELSLSFWSSNGEKFCTGIARDISWRKRSEEQTARHVEQLDEAFMGTIEAITIIGEKRDLYTVGHERRVADIATAIAAEMGLSPNRQKGLHIAGHLHDVGKIPLPAELLSNPGKLSRLEREFIKQHAEFGYDILKNIKSPWPVAQVALQHHERMDGTGYPQGLKGDEILLEARILAVADVVEAISSHRPYRPGLGIDVALEEIENGAGTLYDRQVVKACLHLFRGKGFSILERRRDHDPREPKPGS